MRKKNKNIKKISLNLPVNQINFLDNYAAGNGTDRTSVIRGLIANYINFLHIQGQNYPPIQNTTLDFNNVDSQVKSNESNKSYRYFAVDPNGFPYRPKNSVNPMQENYEPVNPMQENYEPVNPMLGDHEPSDPTDSHEPDED